MMSILNRLKKILFGLVLAAACGPGAVAFASLEHLNVVATNSIIEDLVRNIAGNDISLTALAKADSDPHTYEPKPEDNVKIAAADIIFENGLFLEPWMDKLYKASQSHAQRVKLSDGISLIVNQHNDRHEQNREYDPHIWHDVNNIRIMVKTIREALTKADPRHAQDYQKNAELYDQRLLELDQWITEQTARIPPARRKLVTSHDTFGYFARRYGFTVIGTVIGSATTEASDPSALQMAGLIKNIKSAGVTAIFVENTANPQLVKTVAREAGIAVAPELYSDALGRKGSPAETYIQMMRTNVETIVEALRS